MTGANSKTKAKTVATAAAVGVGVGAAVWWGPGIVLGALGFGSGGVKAGSLAALWHSSIGKVGAGSLFSILQSAGAGGAKAGSLFSILKSAGAAGTTSAGSKFAGGAAVGYVGKALGFFSR